MTSNADKSIIETARFVVNGQLPNDVDEGVFTQVAEAFDQDKNILSVPAEVLSNSFFSHLAILVLNEQGMAIGYSRLIELVNSADDTWYELGSTWVHKDYRNQGLITASYRQLLAEHQDKNILAASSTPAAIAVGKKLGFVFVARKDLPLAAWKACCICPVEKTDSADNDFCKRAYGEPQQSGVNCYTRVTASTADRLAIKVLTPAN